MRILFIFLFVLISSSSFAAPVKEFRGMWVITWEIFKKDGEFLREQALKDRIVKILDDSKTAGLNALMWQVRQGGAVYYPSQIEPWGKWLGHRSPGFDPLAFVLSEAKKRDIEIHAWINTFESREVIPGTPAVEHPEWVSRDELDRPMPGAITLSPGLAPVRQHILSVVEELVSNYRVDGIHFDYVRWSEYAWSDFKELNPDFGYDSMHRFIDGVPEGFLTWEDWRRHAVSTFVRQAGELAHSIRPGINVSVAAVGQYDWGVWNGYHAVFQDVGLWLKEGWIDHVMGMNYYWHTYQRMFDHLVGGCPSCWQRPLQAGLDRGGRFTVGVGSLMMKEKSLWHEHPEVIRAIREADYVSGFQFFSYGDFEEMNYFKEASEFILTSPDL
ncbi:MAG: hypothetical protein CME71_00215 [Halobacteriovorax sp.]|nr:hypothetical protein [Halobacteriovorax sp.]